MSTLNERVARSFARSRDSYREAAQAQKQIAANLFAAYRRLAPGHFPARVLEAGYGTGYLTEHLQTLQPAQLWLNDLSALELPGVRATYLPGDIADLVLPGALSLVASASMLQWVSHPREVLARLCGGVEEAGYLAVSGFSPAHFPELRALGSVAGAPSYLTAEAMASMLPPGWQHCGSGNWEIRCYFPDALSVLRHLRATGVNGSAGQLRSPGAIQEFLTRYESTFRDAQGVPLTYHASWLVAVKRTAN